MLESAGRVEVNGVRATCSGFERGGFQLANAFLRFRPELKPSPGVPGGCPRLRERQRTASSRHPRCTRSIMDATTTPQARRGDAAISMLRA